MKVVISATTKHEGHVVRARSFTNLHDITRRINYIIRYTNADLIHIAILNRDSRSYGNNFTL